MAATGSCLCGAISFRIDPPPRELTFCHCGQCRKAQGSAFATSAPVPAAHFTLLSGSDALRSYRATPSKARYFCGHCGSPIYSQVDGNAMLRVRAGTLDAGVDLTPVAHIYTAERADWHAIGDALPRFPGREPGR